MEHGTETQERKDRSSQQRRRWPFRHRVLAMILILTMLLSSSGLITLAAQAEGEINSTTTESSEPLTTDASEGETDVEAVTETTTQEDKDETPPEPSQEPSAESSEATVTEESTTQATIDGSAGDSDNASVPAAASLDDDGDTAEQPAEESAAISSGSTMQRAPIRRTAAANNINLANYLESVEIKLKADNGVIYPLDELVSKGLTVSKGTYIKVALTFDTITEVPEYATLTYQLPENLFDTSKADENGILFSGEVDEENNDGAEEAAATWTINTDGLLTMTLNDSFFKENKHDDNTIDLFQFNFNLSGSLSSERGEHSGEDDAKLNFQGGTSSGGDLVYTIPFDYKNENARVEVEKSNTFDPTTRKITYTVTATAPSGNTLTADNVKVTDTFTIGSEYLTSETAGDLYQNATASVGSFDTATGVWTIGDMTPGQVATLTYEVQVAKTYFTVENAQVTNKAKATYNVDGTMTATNTLEDAGTLTITKTEPTRSIENGQYYLTYTLSVDAYGGTMDNVVVDDVFNYVDAIDSYETISISQGSISTTPGTDGGVTMKWNVGTVTTSTPATLTYKVAVNGDAWDKHGYTSNNGTSVSRKLNLENTATVTSNDILYDTATTKFDSDWSKTWLSKDGTLSGNTITYTLSVNDSPVSSNLQTIEDSMSGGTYNSDITLNVYNYKGGTLKGTYTVKVADVANGSSGWKIDLSKVPTQEKGTVDLTGRYYYTVSYTASGVLVTNTAGAGVGAGLGTLSVTKTMSGSSFTYAKSIDKSDGTAGYDIGSALGYVNWIVSITSDIPNESGIVDYLTEANVNRCSAADGCSYYTKDQIDGIVVKSGDTTLVKGQDYEITEYTRHSNDGTDSNGDDRYAGFHLKFLHPISASSTNKVTVQYTSHVDMNKVHQNHGGGTINAYNRSVFTYHIDQDDAVSEQEKTAYVAYAPNNQDVEKNFVGYNADTGELVWYIRANVQSDVSGRAYITEYIPTGQTYSSVNIIVAQKGAWFPKALYVMEEDGTQTQIDASSGAEARLLSMMDSSGNNSSISTYAYSGSWTYSGTTSKITIDYENITQEEWIENGVTKGTKVTIPLDNVQGASNNGVGPQDSSWNNNGRFTIRVNTKLDADELVYLASGANKTYSNTVTFSQPNHLVYGDTKTATGAVTNGSKLVTKSEAAQQGPAYVQYALDINPYGYDLMSGDDPLAVVDIMNTDISLAIDKTNYFKVYDVSKADDIYAEDGTVVASKVTANGVDVTDSCYMEDITGTAVNGMAAADAGKLTYQFTVPDSTHLVILYWAEAAGVDGDTVDASNKAYFYYNGSLQVNNSGEVSSEVVISDSGSSVFSGPFFRIKKTDQELNPVEGATFEVYQYVDGTNDVLYTTVTTDENGSVYVGHRNGDNLSPMEASNLYYIVETSAPAGYKVDSTPYYFEFKGTTHDTSNDPTGVTINMMKRGGIYTVVNEFKGASYDVPIKKTLNGENIAGTVPFTFTLKPDANNTVTAYTDSRLTTAVPADGLQVTITGSGETTFDSLYFKEAGTYVFTMTEDDLSSTAIDKGYTKDSTVYTVTIVVAADAVTNAMVIQSATYAANGTTKDITTTNVPTFDNKFGLTGELNLTLHKQLDGNRAKALQDGEFSFKVSVKNSVGTRVVGVIGADGNVQKDENGKTVPQLYYNDANGDIAINIPLTEEDVGDVTVTVSEIKGEDETIDYTTDTVKAYVTISEIGGGKVGQTGETVFRNDNDTFVNAYNATGKLSLTGTKTLIWQQANSPMSLTAGAYSFEVYDGKVKVATGTNDAGGNITFTDIVYYSADIGDHTYTVKEVAGNDANVTYDDTVYTVNVNVADGEQSDGTLTATITGITKQDGTEATAVAFTNYNTTVITPTGLRMDILPYALVAVVAGSIGATMMVRKWKRRKNVV